MRPIKRCLGMGASAILCIGVFATPATARRLPDLRPTSAALEGKRFALIGNPVGARWEGTTKNAGGGAAGPSVTSIGIRHGDTRRHLFSSSIRALRSGRTVSTSAASEGDLLAPAGGYRIWVCADARHKVKESDERNNCRPMANPRNFYVGFQAWTGSVSGTSSASPYGLERWTSDDSSFHFTHYEDPGDFSYDEWTGSVDYAVQGTDEDGCAYYGRSVTSSGDGGLGLHYTSDRYFGFASLHAGYVTIQSNCNGELDYHEQTQGFDFFDTSGPEAFGRDLRFGMRRLAGNVNDNAGTAYSWNLVGDRD